MLILVCALAVAVLCGARVEGAAQIEVLQPDSDRYTASQHAQLTAAIAGLESVLADRTLGSQRATGEQGWGTTQFAAFSAGALAGRGYNTLVVSVQRGGGTFAWVLVGVDVGSGVTAWIPVDPNPGPSAVQSTAGRIPWAVSGRYDASYITFERVVELGPNAPPTASIRAQTGAIRVETGASFLALVSRDADGEIIAFLWSVDGGAPTRTKSSTYEHTFVSSGEHAVTLTVVDNRGARSSASITIRVYGLDELGRPTSPGCGCGG
jgi:PKD repeat protein